MGDFQKELQQLNVSDFKASEATSWDPQAQSPVDQSRLCFVCTSTCFFSCFFTCFNNCFQNCYHNCFHNCFNNCFNNCFHNCFHNCAHNCGSCARCR